ncbi:MAG: hypothetical protein AB8F34_10140 [Akkermansiaceae bacterium]
MHKPQIERNRRQFIADRLKAVGTVKYKEIFGKFGKVSRQQLKIDAKILLQEGTSIASARDGRDGVFFSPDSHHAATYEYREKHNVEAKQKIATAVENFLTSIKDETIEGIESTWSLKFCGDISDPKYFALEKKITRLLNKHSRCVFLDSGTTVSQIANQITKFDPTHENSVSSLHIWTNNRQTFYKLGHPKCEVHTAILGGVQRFKTSTLGGPLTNNFATEYMPDIDLAILGVSWVSKKSSETFVNHAEDAELKRIITKAKSTFNIMVLDTSKLVEDPTGEKIVRMKTDGLIDLLIFDKDPDWDNCPIPIAFTL